MESNVYIQKIQQVTEKLSGIEDKLTAYSLRSFDTRRTQIYFVLFLCRETTAKEKQLPPRDNKKIIVLRMIARDAGLQPAGLELFLSNRRLPR